MRSSLHKYLRRQNASKANKTWKLVDISPEGLKDWLEIQFDDDMSWENTGEWHIDHVRPCTSFILSESEQQQVAFNWRNLQPLWGAENIKKGDEYEPHHEVEWARRMRELGYEGELFLLFEERRGGLYGSQTD